MFGNKPWMNPIITLDSAKNIPFSDGLVSSDTISLSPESSSSLASCSNERPRKRQKVNETLLEELVVIAQENKEERKNMYKETAERQERLLNILENIANKM
ncbi:unnamed protein product [Lasius platythorax]|uniref:Uncharacterized protein n=1 Tax=Lasius platythorax TaxID=488582 RepID=A0AAV2N3X0_9HYME